MALLSDDCDVKEVYMRTMLGGNGDYYLELTLDEHGDRISICTRISTGGNAPSEVKIAMAELFRAMEKHGLNEYID